MSKSWRRVYRTGKDSDGDITKLCNSAADWSPRLKASAIADIEAGAIGYFVEDSRGNQAVVKVMTVGYTKHLTTTPDKSSENNLDNLPDC